MMMTMTTKETSSPCILLYVSDTGEFPLTLATTPDGIMGLPDSLRYEADTPDDRLYSCPGGTIT